MALKIKPQDKHPLADVAEKINNMKTGRANAITALKESITMDHGNPPEVKSVATIASESGLAIEVLHGLKIILSIREAYDFFKDECGLPINNAFETFRKKYRGKGFKETFYPNKNMTDSEVKKLLSYDGNAIVYTYAQWLHMLNVSGGLTMPPGL